MSLPTLRYKETYLSSMLDTGNPVQNAVFFLSLQLGSSYWTGSFTSLSRAKKKKSVGASHSYFRTCNLVICFIFGASSKTQRKLLQPYYRIFTCFVSSPTLQKVVLTLSKNLSVYTKTYEGNTHRVSAYDTYINTRNVKKHCNCVVGLTKGP